jgi:zinc protease
VCLVLAAGSIAWAAPQAKSPEKQAEQKQGTAAVPAGVKLTAQMPKGAPTKPFAFPKAVTRTLVNGLRVFVVPNSEQPAVTVRLVLTAAGAANDPAGKPGVAAMTADLLNQGTAKRSAQQISEAIDFVGGSLSASAGSDSTGVTATVVKKDLALAMDLLSDVTLNAAFQEEEIARRRQQLLSNLHVQYSDADYLATVIFDRVLFGAHPYGLPSEGTPESVRKIERADLVRFRGTYYAPNLALLAFAGDITPEAAFAAADKYFGAWTRKEAPAARAGAPQQARGHHVFIVDKPDAVQTQIRVGRMGIRRNDPDFIPLVVTNRIFGGGFNSRLSTEVRIRKGLTYGAYSNFESAKQGGSFVAATFTRTEATVEATRLVVDLVNKMATGEVTQAELDFARDYLAGVYPIQSETPEQVAGRILTVADYNLPADYNDTYPQKVLAVGPAEVKAMAGKYFTTQNLEIVVVGNAKEFREALKREFAGAKFEELPFDQVDLLSANLRRAAQPAVAASPESAARGRQILQAAAQAAGGEAIKRIESVAFAASGEFNTPQGSAKFTSKLQIRYPSSLWMEIALPMVTFQQGYDGKAGWIASPQGAMDLPAAQSAEAQRGIDLFGCWGMFRRVLAGELEASFVGEKQFEGRSALAVEWKSGAGPVTLFVDPATNLLVGAGYRATTLDGIYDVVQVWSDFREVEGAKVPFHWVQYRDGAKFADQMLSDVKINVKLDDKVFVKP